MQSQVFQNSKSSENRTQLVKKVFFDKLTMASHEKKDGAPMKAERPYPQIAITPKGEDEVYPKSRTF